jgi:hypothetical protein
MKTYIVGVLVFLSIIVNPDASAAGTSSAASSAKVFESAISLVKKSTQTQILLPSELPAPLQEKDIHFAQGSAKPNGYEITLFYEEGAGYAAFVGYFAGEANGKLDTTKQKLNLANGITGYFKGKSCGGSCSPSQIQWLLGSTAYTIQLKLSVKTKAEEEQALISVANSAILGGAR